MIHVIITGPPTTSKERSPQFPYRIEGHSVGGGVPIGPRWSNEPLLDACRILKEMGEPADRLVGLYDTDKYTAEPDWRMRTTVGYGARFTVEEGRVRFNRYKPSFRGAVSPGMRYSDDEASQPPLDAGVPTEDDMADYREFPGGPIKSVGGPSVATPAKSAAPPPPPSTPPAPPADTGPVAATPAKSKKSHRPRKAKGSGGRRAGSRGR